MPGVLQAKARWATRLLRCLFVEALADDPQAWKPGLTM